MELTESIKTAWTAVEESGVPEHMQELAFREALRSLLGTTPLNAALAGGGRTPSPPFQAEEEGSFDGAGEAPPMRDEEVLQRVSEETAVPIEKLEKVFHIDGEAVKLIGPHGKFGSSASDQARTVASIVTVVRRLGMGHADTSYELIKEACESKHCYDSKNFASQHMPKIDGFVVKGEGRNRRLEARSSGISAFPALIEKVLGES